MICSFDDKIKNLENSRYGGGSGVWGGNGRLVGETRTNFPLKVAYVMELQKSRNLVEF